MRLSYKQVLFAKLKGRLFVYADKMDIPVKEVEYWRSPEKQARLYKAKLTDTMDSKHIVGLAMDLAIIDNEGMTYVTDPDRYLPLGEFWESMGGTWGGRWRLRSGAKDPFHFEWNGITPLKGGTECQ